MFATPRTRRPICKRSVRMLQAGCSTATIRTGNASGKPVSRAGWRALSGRCRATGARWGNCCGFASAVAAVVALVDVAAIRAGGEDYARDADSRGAAPLLKSDVTISGTAIRLRFTGKGGKRIVKEFRSAPLVTALRRLRRLPGPRLFQYRTDDGSILRVRATEVNAFLRDLAGKRISLKDFRTLSACAHVLEQLAQTKRASSERQRRRQVRDA